MKYLLFTYGSLILEKSPVRVIPIESAFILEHKLRLKFRENSLYTLLIAQYTGCATDIISGYLAEVSEEELYKIDKYEGKEYERVEVLVYKRKDRETVKAFMYKQKNR